jgi:regulator of protease activity HflC (stomatin/prohibitin superfamily)
VVGHHLIAVAHRIRPAGVPEGVSSMAKLPSNPFTTGGGREPRPPREPRQPRPGRRRLLLVAVLAVLAVVLGSSAFGSAVTKTQAGEVAVVRNGGPLDNNRIRQIVQPASSLTWIGLFSTKHTYPAQQRFYTITADASRGDRTGVDVENLPTADGVEVGVEGTVYFSLNTDPAILRTFDDKYGTRRYRGVDGTYRYAWEDDDGWSTFLDQIVRPVISNDLREEVGNFPCSELQASCALVQNGGSAQAVNAVAGKGNLNIAKIQDSINTSLAQDLTSTLGGGFIIGVRFNLAKITLPTRVQEAINQAQAAFAGVTEAQAKVQQAKAEAQANTQRQLGYQACPACAQIDTMKAIPPTVTTFAPGSGFAITAPAAAAPKP